MQFVCVRGIATEAYAAFLLPSVQVLAESIVTVIPALSNINNIYTRPIPLPMSKFVVLSKIAIQAACGAQCSATSGTLSTPRLHSNDTNIPASPTSCMCPAADYTYSLPIFTCARELAKTIERVILPFVLFQAFYQVHASPSFLHRAFATLL